MVQCLTSAFGSGDSYVQIVLDPGLPDEVIKPPGSEASIKWYVLSGGFTRYNAVYFNLNLLKAPKKIEDFSGKPR